MRDLIEIVLGGIAIGPACLLEAEIGGTLPLLSTPLTSEITGGLLVGEGGSLSMQQLREAVSNFLNQNAVGKTFQNADTGLSIGVSGRSAKKTQRVGPRLLRMHYALPEILRESVFVSDEQPRQPKAGYIRMRNLGIKVQFDSRFYPVVVRIRQFANGHWYYALNDMT